MKSLLLLNHTKCNEIVRFVAIVGITPPRQLISLCKLHIAASSKGCVVVVRHLQSIERYLIMQLCMPLYSLFLANRFTCVLTKFSRSSKVSVLALLLHSQVICQVRWRADSNGIKTSDRSAEHRSLVSVKKSQANTDKMQFSYRINTHRFRYIYIFSVSG